jgi:hypothetical protein
MLVVEGMTTGELQAPPLVIFAATALASVAIALRVYGSIRPETTIGVVARPVVPQPSAAR